MSKQLWFISDELKTVLEVLEGGEMTPEQEEAIDAHTGALASKASQIARYIEEEEAKSRLIYDRGKELINQAGMIAKKCDRLRAYLKTNMERVGTLELADEATTIKLVRNPPKLVIHRELEDIPDEYVIKVVGKRPDNAMIKDAVSKGKIQDWAEIVQETRVKIC